MSGVGVYRVGRVGQSAVGCRVVVVEQTLCGMAFWLKRVNLPYYIEKFSSLFSLVPRISAHKLRLLAGRGAVSNCGKQAMLVFALSLGAASLSHLANMGQRLRPLAG